MPTERAPRIGRELAIRCNRAVDLRGEFWSQQLDRVCSIQGETKMGKYFIAWLLGVPAGLLVLVYLFMHL
jgi:hypothetical protein